MVDIKRGKGGSADIQSPPSIMIFIVLFRRPKRAISSFVDKVGLLPDPHISLGTCCDRPSDYSLSEISTMIRGSLSTKLSVEIGNTHTIKYDPGTLPICYKETRQLEEKRRLFVHGNGTINTTDNRREVKGDNINCQWEDKPTNIHHELNDIIHLKCQNHPHPICPSLQAQLLACIGIAQSLLLYFDLCQSPVNAVRPISPFGALSSCSTSSSGLAVATPVIQATMFCCFT
jgi:hypothetical protein